MPADAAGLERDPPERKMGLTGSTTATVRFDGVRVAGRRRLGDEGDGLRIALAGLDSGRLGIAAVRDRAGAGRARPGRRLRQGARAVRSADRRLPGPGVHARRHGGGRRVGPGDVPARRPARDRGLPFGRQAAVAKLVGTDNAMRVTTDAVQVLGGYGYTRDFPVERYMREAKVMQIFEGTNQIQRMVIGRALGREPAGSIRTVGSAL